MGQGRGQDFQAGTSGTQGRFYAVVPQTELADQSDMRGTFSLSQECCLNSDASYSCLYAIACAFRHGVALVGEFFY